MKIQIKNRLTLEVMFEVEATCKGGAVKKIIADDRNANLSYANLSDANLRNADLSDANLSDADLRNADLWNTNLSFANLRFADLRNADLSDANLRNADLWNANLWNANLSYADLSYADLSYANLSDANLRNAKLWGCIGNMLQVKSAQLDKWVVTWTAERLQIGCKNFSIKEWFDFSDEEISEMDSEALEWWKKHKELVKLMIETSPAEPTGNEEVQS